MKGRRKKKAYNGHLLASRLPEGLGPAHLPGIPLHLEVLVTFRATEPEELQAGTGGIQTENQRRKEGNPFGGFPNLGIVSDKHDPMPWIHG